MHTYCCYLWVHGYWFFSRIGIIHSFSVTVHFALKVPMTATSRGCWRCAKFGGKVTITIPLCLANTACKEQWLSWLSKNNKTGYCFMQQTYFCICMFSQKGVKSSTHSLITIYKWSMQKHTGWFREQQSRLSIRV